ncbi:centrosome-associated protein ALMS1 isoform X3 [Desmodus rotundus]|uniref:centrosome-associated protein ALMS1 isoform X3 n=1 Tax=Desmodus rotundus TaxID=9430 RepID=UPI002380D0DB|nr:centrosome-associated protein ALMS1 isoform X3 [Desmodus rotundus]
MEPEDLPWPGELEEEEEEEEEEEAEEEEEVQEEKEEVEKSENLDEDEVVTVEDEEVEERRELDADFNYESQPRESTDDEEDEEAKAWLQAHPSGTLPPPSLPKHRYSESERTGLEKVVPLTSNVWQQSSYQDKNRTAISDSNVVSLEETAQWGSEDDQKTEFWHFLPQEIDSSHTSDTTQTRFKVREEGTEMTDFPSVEEGILTQSENQVKEPNRDLFCSSLLVIQDSFASPDLPLLTCLTQDQEFGPDSLFHQSELDFAPLRAIPGKSEDTEWFSRPSEVSEALFQAASEVASDLVNSHFSVSQHTLTGSTAVESQGSFLHPEQGSKEETVSSGTVDELKTPKDSDSYDALCSYMSWKTQEVTQEPETNLVNKDQLSFSTSSDTSEEYVTPKERDGFDASCLYVQYWKQEALPQSEKYLTSKDHDSCSDSSDTIDKNKISEGIGNFSAPLSCMPWSEQGASHHPETCAVSKDHVSCPHDVAPHFNNRMSYSFLHCLLERRGKSVPLMSSSQYFESVYLRAPAENEVEQKMVSLEGYERNEEDLGKELSRCFELKENSNTLVFLELCPSSSEVQYIENVVVPDNSVKVSETHILSREHDISKVETSGGPLQTITSTLDETSEQLCFQEERNQKASAAFGGKNVNATENVAFEAVIASIEPSKKENTGNEIQTDITKSLTNYSQDSKPKNSDLFLLNYNDASSFFDKFSHPHCQSTPGVLEPAASKPLLHKKDDDVSSLYWHTNAKSLPGAPQEMFIRPLSSASLSEKSHSQVVGLCKTQSPLFQCGVDNEPFLPIAEKAGSSNIIYPLKVSTSDSLFLQDLKQQTFEEVADSSNYILGKNVNSSHVIERPSAAVGSSFSANLVAYDAESQGTLPMTSDASLIAVGQETLLKADTGLGEIPWPMGATSSFMVHTIIQNDSYFVEGLQGKSESDIYTLGDDTECCSLDENAVVCSKRSTELQREVCDQGDLSGECIEVACLENLLDDLEICDSSMPWQCALQQPSKEESSFEEPVGHSDLDINHSFSSVLPPFVPHEPNRELEYHSSDLRMLRVSPEIVPKTLKHLSGDISEGSITEITQSNLKAGITTTSGDSDIGSYLPLTPEDFPQLVVRSSVENTLHLHTDSLNKQILADGHVTEEALKGLAIPELADQKTGISTLPSSSYSLREKPSIFYPQPLRENLTEGALTVSAIPGPADQKTSLSTVPPSSYLLGEKHSIFSQQALPDSDQTEEASKVPAVLGPTDQKSEKTTVPSSSFSHRERHAVFSQQQLPDSHLTEQTAKVLATARQADQVTVIPTASSTLYSHAEKPHIFFRQALPGSHLTEQALKVSAPPGSTEQKTGIPTVSSTSYPHREKPSPLYQQELPETHLPEQSQQAAAVSGFADQEAGIPTGTSTSYSHGEKPLTFHQQTLPASHLTEQALKVSSPPGSTEQKTGIPTVSSTAYPHRGKPSSFYQQELPESHLPEQSQQAAAVSIFTDQKAGIPTGTSTSYSHGEKPLIFYQQTLPGSHLTEQALKVSAPPGSTEQKTGIPTVSSSSYPHRGKPSSFYQQELPESHLPEQSQQDAAVSGFADQKAGIPTGTSTSYSHGEKPLIFYQQTLPGSHLTEQALKVSAVPGSTEQKTGIPTVSSSSYPHRGKPSPFYQQELPESHLPEQSQQDAAVSISTDQKAGIPTGTSTSYSHGEKPLIFYQQTLPGSHLTEQALKVSAAPGSTEQKTGIPTVSSTAYPHRGKPSSFYQQELPESHLPEQSQQAAAVSISTDQKAGVPTGTSTSYSHGEKPLIFYQQTLLGSHLTEQALKVSAPPGLADQRSGIPTVSSTSYSHTEKPNIIYQQELPVSHLTKEAQKVPAVPGPAQQKTGLPVMPPTSYSHRGKTIFFSQQEFPDSHLIKEALKVSSVLGPAEQNTGIPSGSSGSYSFEEKPSVFYQQTLPDSHLTEESLKVSSVPGDQKTGILTIPSSSNSHREKPSISYEQELPDSHLTEQAQKVSTVPGTAEQKTGIPTITSTSYSRREKPFIFNAQGLPDSHLPEDALKVKAVPGLADQKAGLPSEPSGSYSHRDKPIIFYPQDLPDTHLTEEALKVPTISGPADQRTGIPEVPSTSYPHGEKHIFISPQALPDSHLHEEALKVSTISGPANQKIGFPSEPSSSYSHREKPIIFYPQGLPDSHLPDEALKVTAVPGPADQKTGIPSEPSGSYSHREKPVIFYPQGLPDSHLPEEALKVTAVPGPADQKTGIPSEPSGSYSHREKSSIFYQQELPDSHLTEEAPKVSAVPGTGDQKTGIPTVPTSAYSVGGKSINFYQQALPDRHITEEVLNVSASPEPAEQKTGLPTVSSTSYSQREKPFIFYPQALPDNQLTEQAFKISAVPLPGDQNTRKPTAISTSYSHREKPIISYQQELPGSHLTEEALKGSGVLGTADQKTGIPIIPSNSYSYREKPISSYKQDLTQVALKVLGGFRPAGQKTGIPVVTSTSYSHEEKPIISYQQELPDHNEDASKLLAVPGAADQKTDTQIVPPSSYSHRESSISSYPKDLPDITEKTLEVSTVAGPTEQKTGIRIIPSGSYSYREKGSTFYQHELPDTTEEALKVFVVPVPAGQKTEISAGPSSSYSLEEKPKISTVVLPDDQKTELPTASSTSYSHREKPKNLTVIGPDDQKTPLLTVFRNSYSQKVKPSIFFKQHLPGGHRSEDILKASSVPEPTDVNSGIPTSSSYSNREKSNILSAQELPEKHLTEDVLKVSTILEPDNQKTVLPTAPPRFFSHREKPNIFYQQDLPDRRLTEDSLKFSSGLGPADQITGLSTVHSGTYSHSEKHKLVSDHVQKLIDNLDSSNSSIISNNMPLNSQADYRVVVNKTEPSGFEDVGSEEIQYTDNSSKTLKQIQTLLMEAENIALKRCNFPAPLVPFRDVSDISFIQSKKVVCFKEPCTPDESNVDLPLRKPFTEENPSSKYIQKDINTETNLKCQRGIENWEFISSTTVRSPIQEAENKARVALDETLRQYKAARSVMRSEPDGCSGTFRNKILIPMMTIIKSDSSSDASSCSWDSNSLESVSDVLLNLLPYASPKTSMTDSREEECVSESDDGGGSVDSLAAHVKNLLKCESSLNHAKQILRNAEEEECRVRARAWNLKFNMAHECGYSISELNEDDRRKVEEIKAKLFSQDDLSKGLQSPRGIGCKPEAVCSHVIIESHEKGCFRTLTAKQPQLDSHPCVFRSAEPLEIIRRQRSPLWRPRHINLSKSLDHSNPHFKACNSLQLQSHSPFQNFTGDDFRISKDFRMPFREKMDPWLSELVEPNCLPPEEMDCHSSSQMLPPESMKKFTSITFSSHRHSKCFSDSSVLKVGVTEDSQCTGTSVGVFNSHFTEEQSPPRDLKQKTSSPSLFKVISHSPDKAVTILAESSSQGQKLSVEHSHQEEKLSEKSDFKGSISEPSTSTNCSKFKEVHFSDNHTLISMGRPSSALGVKEKNVTLTPNPPSHIFLEQQELFEQSKAPHADHYVGKHHSPPPQHQHYVVPNLPCHIFLEKRELLEQSNTPHVDHQMREKHSPFPQGQDYIASDLPSSIFLEQRQLLEQSQAPGIDHHIEKQYSPLPQGQDYVVEKNSSQNKPPKSHISNINVETKVNSVVSQSGPNQHALITSPSTPPSNRKALSCVRITISPRTSSNLDSGTLDKRFLSLDPASKTRMNNEFNSDLQTISSRSLEPTSKLLTSKPVAHDQESLGFLGPTSSPDFQVKQSLPDGNTVTKDLKTIPFQNSQIVTSRQTQVNFSDLEEYSNPEGTPKSADRSVVEIKPPFSAFSGKLSSDAVTQITTESPGKAMFSSEIFINSEDHGHEISKPSSQKLGKVPVRFASSSAVQQITIPDATNGGSNDAIAPDFPAQVLGTRDDNLPFTVNIKHKEGIYSKRAVTKASSLGGEKPFQKDNADAQVQVLISADENLSDKNKKKEIYNKKAVTKPAQSEEIEFLQKDTADSSDAVAAKLSAQLQNTKMKKLPDTKAIKQKEEIHSKRTFPKEAWTEDKESLQINIEESRCHSEFENTTHSVFRSAKFYFHHPVHLPSDQDFCHESLGRSVFMRHSWKDFFQHHPDKQHTCLPPPYQNEEKTKTDYTRIESVSINVNLENKEVMHPTKSQARDYAKCDKQIDDQKKDRPVTPEPVAQHITSLNELWNKYQERQKQKKPPGFSDRKEVSLVERLDRLAKLLQHPITHSLRPLESSQDDSREQRDAKEWRGRQQQKNKLQKKKRYKSLEKCHKNIGDLKKSKVLSTHQAGGSNHIKIEQVKFDKYILRKQPGFHYINSTSSDSRPSEDSELLTDTATNILSTTTSPGESDILTQTDKEVILHERSSSASTIDTARLIQAFGHERVCLSPRQIKLYSSITDHQRRYIEKRSKNKKKALSTSYPQMTSEHTRRKRIQVANHMISSDSISSSTGSFWSSSSTLCNKQNAHMLNKGVQAGNLEIVNGVRKHTRDVGVIFPTPSSSEVRVEEDSDVTTWSEEKTEEKRVVTSYLGDKKLRKNKQSCSEGVSWFVPVENMKSGPKKENLLKHHGPGISWFAPMTNVKPWREPLREQNWQGQHTDSHGSPAGPGRGPLKPFVRATLQESLQLHRPDFISRSGERIKRLKLIVQERKLQNMFQSEREALFNTVREWQGHRDPMRLLPKRGFLAAQKGRPIGKKEMIQRSKRIYEQLPEVQKKREEEKRRLEYKSHRLRAQLYKKKVTNQLLGRKVPWD